MTCQAVTRKPARSRPAGFTLIELMAVILIIAILIALAFPAINAVLRAARTATATAEIAAIGSAVADFESEFGKQPPSYISFVVTGGSLPPATKAILRSMFPQISFSTATTPNIQTDLTAAGLWGKELTGIEALVFFLGGVRKDINGGGVDASELELAGFSKNPARPFAQPTAGQSTRLGPFFEFDVSRLVDKGGVGGGPNGVLEYVDKLPDQTAPLIYVSTARTGSYVASDANVPPVGTPPVPWEPYQKSDQSFYNPSTYQLISPGYDANYGKGGLYNDDQPAEGEDADNLTNFAEGELGG